MDIQCIIYDEINCQFHYVNCLGVNSSVDYVRNRRSRIELNRAIQRKTHGYISFDIYYNAMHAPFYQFIHVYSLHPFNQIILVKGKIIQPEINIQTQINCA